MTSFVEFRSEEKWKLSQPIRGQGSHLDFGIDQKSTNLMEDIMIFLSSFYEFHSAVSKKSKMSQTIRGWGSLLGFPIGPKNTNLVEDVEIFLPVKFH